MDPATLSTATDAEAQAELKTLQGAWVSIAGQRPLHLFFAGRRFTASFVDGRLYMGCFELRLDDDPHIMIMHIEEGPAKHKGQTAWCIYDLERDQLRWCPAEPGSGERLVAFPSVTDRRYSCSVFRREPARG
jgi:uncharacterized protein (TIGR03067 family)